MNFTPLQQAIISLLLASMAAYEAQGFIANAIEEYERNKRPDYSRIGRVRARKTGKGFRYDGLYFTDDDNEWLVKTIEI